MDIPSIIAHAIWGFIVLVLVYGCAKMDPPNPNDPKCDVFNGAMTLYCAAEPGQRVLCTCTVGPDDQPKETV